jgi:thioredoxin reductase (NADPH)
MDEGGYLRVKPGTAHLRRGRLRRRRRGTDDVYRQAVTAAGMGCMAALEAGAA